ncbi:MAG TPA: helix-turn-helix domain-containing GNAT family N-acetyltransferase [Allosphingosinicella sp.]|nr:helix-turn-helix domain-containing GNAT family N-acetyltransferase [Allosphingosinicella sp.]
MDDAVAAVRAFNRFYTRFAGALDAHYMDSDLSLTEARLLYEIANRAAALAADLQADLGLDAGYVSRILRRFQAKGWIERGRGEDGRRRPISLTKEGRAAFDRLDAQTRAEVAGRIERLSEGDRETLAAALETITGLLSGGEAPWRIRTFRTGDLFTIAARQSILYEPYGWGRPMEILQGEITTAFLRDFKPGREQCWVAERAGLMAGSVLLVDAGGNVGQLRLLYVEPWARGLGIGQALVGECVNFAREADYDRVRLWTHTVLESARRIYEAAGFRITETAIHHEFGEPVQGETWELALKA